ncbi:hypothetical protein C8R43DRAFT_1010632, partial [Mycena crocata]
MVFILWRWLPFFSVRALSPLFFLPQSSSTSTHESFPSGSPFRLEHLEGSPLGSGVEDFEARATPTHGARPPHQGQHAEQPAPDRPGVRRHVRARAILASSPPAFWGPLVRGCAAGTGEEEG